MRPFALILLLFASALVSTAGETNYSCVVCGKGPLTGRIWMSKWGAVCDDCYKLENRCSLCGLPIGKDYVKTGDGRFICKLDKPNAVLDASGAKEIFTDVRRELVELFGSGFALNFPEVTVNLFDVDYWTEKGRGNGLHKFGFSSTRRAARGQFTHEVVMLSGRLRSELAATAAHEYTHLWINENCTRKLDADTVEGICELAAYKLMESRLQPEQQRRILDNPYSHGEIKRLVAMEKENGIVHILNWVRNGTAESFETMALAAPMKPPALVFTNVPPPLPETLRLGGLMLDGQNRRAIISGESFAPGETRTVKLQSRSVPVRCREIRRNDVVLEVDGLPGPVTLKLGEERFVP